MFFNLKKISYLLFSLAFFNAYSFESFKNALSQIRENWSRSFEESFGKNRCCCCSKRKCSKVIRNCCKCIYTLIAKRIDAIKKNKNDKNNAYVMYLLSQCSLDGSFCENAKDEFDVCSFLNNVNSEAELRAILEVLTDVSEKLEMVEGKN